MTLLARLLVFLGAVGFLLLFLAAAITPWPSAAAVRAIVMTGLGLVVVALLAAGAAWVVRGEHAFRPAGEAHDG